MAITQSQTSVWRHARAATSGPDFAAASVDPPGPFRHVVPRFLSLLHSVVPRFRRDGVDTGVLVRRSGRPRILPQIPTAGSIGGRGALQAPSTSGGQDMHQEEDERPARDRATRCPLDRLRSAPSSRGAAWSLMGPLVTAMSWTRCATGPGGTAGRGQTAHQANIRVPRFTSTCTSRGPPGKGGPIVARNWPTSTRSPAAQPSSYGRHHQHEGRSQCASLWPASPMRPIRSPRA